jgi:hypothetical protein
MARRSPTRDQRVSSDSWRGKESPGVSDLPTPGATTESILEQTSGEGLKGLLVSLLSLFDTDNTRQLTQDEYVAAAAPLGFDVSPEAWAKLCARFGDQQSKKPRATGDDAAAPAFDTSLDLTLLGAYFSNKYDHLLEEVVRRLLKGIVSTNSRAAALEKRLGAVEGLLDSTIGTATPARACVRRRAQPSGGGVAEGCTAHGSRAQDGRWRRRAALRRLVHTLTVHAELMRGLMLEKRLLCTASTAC